MGPGKAGVPGLRRAHLLDEQRLVRRVLLDSVIEAGRSEYALSLDDLDRLRTDSEAATAVDHGQHMFGVIVPVPGHLAAGTEAEEFDGHGIAGEQCVASEVVNFIACPLAGPHQLKSRLGPRLGSRLERVGRKVVGIEYGLRGTERGGGRVVEHPAQTAIALGRDVEKAAVEKGGGILPVRRRHDGIEADPLQVDPPLEGPRRLTGEELDPGGTGIPSTTRSRQGRAVPRSGAGSEEATRSMAPSRGRPSRASAGVSPAEESSTDCRSSS